MGRAAYLKKIIKYLEPNAQRRDKRNLLEVRDITGINKLENEELYDIFIDKLSNTIYQYRPANPKDALVKGRDKFIDLDLAQQCIVLGEVLHLFQCKPITANLVLIGGSPNAGKMQITKTVSNCDSVRLVSHSVTGIKERVIDLLKV